MEPTEPVKSMRIGEVLQKWRLLSNKNVTMVAGEIGIKPRALRRLEEGDSKPSWETMQKVLGWLTEVVGE